MQTFLRTVARVVGSEVIDDVVAFFRAFEGMEDGFRERAIAVEQLLAEPTTAFVLVTSPRRDALEEAAFFAERLGDHDQAVASADRQPRASRVRRRVARRAPRRAPRRCERCDRGRRRERAARRALRQPRRLPRDRGSEREHLDRAAREPRRRDDRLRARTSPRDVYDFEALHEVGKVLIGDREANELA